MSETRPTELSTVGIVLALLIAAPVNLALTACAAGVAEVRRFKAQRRRVSHVPPRVSVSASRLH